MKNDLNAEVKSDLVNFASAVDGVCYLCLGDTVRGDSPLRSYYYSSSSSVTADGELVLDATGMSGVGRFIKTPDVPGTGKRQETYSGSTNASGNYTVTFGTAYAAAPNIQANITGGTALQRSTITSITTTGFTVNVVSQNTNTLLGIVSLVSSTTLVNGASVDVLITEK